MNVDRWGDPISGTAASVAAWDSAWEQFVHFRGDPVATLEAVAHDDTFAIGSVFAALYRVLAGASLTAAEVTANFHAARDRAADERDREHLAALEVLVRGDFTDAGDRWARIGAEHDDFAAMRFAHDVFLHVGDNLRRHAASERALAVRAPGRPGRSLVESQHAFSLNEIGEHRAAERLGRQALEADPYDLWARHAIAHVYEDLDDSAAARVMLSDSVDVWRSQDGLALHMWWHLALRLLADGEIGAVFDVFDEHLPAAITPFRLCDMTSLLWRAELAGFDVGDRWDVLADRWEHVAERHTCGFVDLHAALAFVRRPDHPGSDTFFDGLAARPHGGAEIDEVFHEIVRPLVGALRVWAVGDADGFADTVDTLGDSTARIGGSNAQRSLITATREVSR